MSRHRASWGWGHAGTLDWDRSRRPDRGPLPTDWLEHHGHYVHGDRVVLSYAVDNREVLELPGVDRSSGLPVILSHDARAGHAGGRTLQTRVEEIAMELTFLMSMVRPEAGGSGGG